MIDLHAHVLPGIDDGPETLDEAVAMLRTAHEDGTTVLVATPHQRHPQWPNEDRALLERKLAELRAAAGDRAPRLELGAEISVDSDLLREIDRLPNSPLVPLAGSRYLLLELSPGTSHEDLRALLHELLVAGWLPIVAHTERYPWLAAEPAHLIELHELGVQLQVTAMSLTGGFGRRAQACAEFMLEHGIADLVASDAHDIDDRPPVLSQGRRLVASRWGETRAARLFEENPLLVVENLPFRGTMAQ
jgi:protein-tyrosine phosphatase